MRLQPSDIATSTLRPQLLSLLFLLCLTVCLLVSGEHGYSQPNVGVDERRKQLGENALRKIESQASSSLCWKEALSHLNSTCKSLTDIDASRLAVAFANCHLQKSGRKTYPCSQEMTIKECTSDMDSDAFQTYTHFFTHTGHICYFLQNELWQERTEGTIGRLSDTSSEAVEKLELALDYHRKMEQKQILTLSNQEAILDQDRKIAESLEETRQEMGESFNEMNELANRQKLLLSEMFGTLQQSVDIIRNLMSLLLIKFVGFETFVTFVIAWLVIIFLPQFGYSRLKLHLVLFTNLCLEIVIRWFFAHFVFGSEGQIPAESLVGHNIYSSVVILFPYAYSCIQTNRHC